MKWLRIALLLLAMTTSGPVACRANVLVPDAPPSPRQNPDEESDRTIALSGVGIVIAIAIGVSVITLRRIRRQNDKRPE
jgi:hypothetical protein